MVNHDVKAGTLDYCQICGSYELPLVIDLGHQPLCDSLLTDKKLNAPESYYPLRLRRCQDCTLTQLDYIVEGVEVYYKDYPYRTGVTKELVEYQTTMCQDLVKKYKLDKNSFVVDIGSNDGTLLNAFKEFGIRVLGVEPTNIARIALQNGIDTIQEFFTEKLGNEIIHNYSQATLITATNVFAHMASLGEVVRGIHSLLKQDGVFVLENHYLVDVLQKTQYDSIYHEHIRTYTLKSLMKLFSFYGLTVFHAERVSRYGGNIRVHVCKGNTYPIDSSVGRLLKLESDLQLDQESIYDSFRQRVRESRNRLLDFAHHALNKNLRFVGNSCPGRSNTLLHYCNINKDIMPYIAEQPLSLKKGLYSPGKHIPIVDNSILFKEQPDYVVLLAWHYAEPIAAQLRNRGLKSKLIQPLPVCTVLDEKYVF